MKPPILAICIISLIASLIATSIQAAVINVPDFSFTPDGSATIATDDYDFSAVTTLPNGSPDIFYVVATFNWGENSDAHLRWRFNDSRVELNIQDNGAVSFFPGSYNLSQDMAGQSLTVICQVDYDSTYDFNGSGGRDTRQKLWFAPTGASTVGSPDAVDTWNNTGMTFIRRYVDNQLTPGTAGTSSITDMVILTDSDATFANALSFAGIPEPSTLLLGGLGGLLLLRRRR